MTRARDVANLIGSGNYSSTTFTATAGQTAFTISHTQGFIQVFMNGLLLDETVDYTSNGSAVTLTSGAAAGDEIEVVAYNTFSVGDALNQAAADTRYVNASGDTMTGDLTIDTNTFHVDVADNTVGIGTTAPTNNLTIIDGGATPYGSDATILLDMKRNTANTDAANAVALRLANNSNGFNIKYGGASDTLNISGGSGNTVATFRNDGGVTTPYQPAFSVRSNVGNSGNTWTQNNVIKFQSVQHNVGSHYSTSTGRFTAPVAGFYVFHYAGFGFNGGHVPSNSTTGVALRRNGTTYTMFVYNLIVSSAGYPSSTGSVGLYLAANDYVDIYTTGQGQYADGSLLYTHWSGYLLH